MRGIQKDSGRMSDDRYEGKKVGKSTSVRQRKHNRDPNPAAGVSG